MGDGRAVAGSRTPRRVAMPWAMVSSWGFQGTQSGTPGNNFYITGDRND
jgi:hypothetical protein